ncbi:MAG: Clp protease N-terminal domain-containing protein, partial [Flavobacteriales bacterium]
MDLNKFTLKSQEAIQQAQQVAMENEHQAIENGHILKGILNADDSVTPYILKKLSVNFEHLKKALDKIVQSYPKVQGGQLHLSQNANQTIQKAMARMNKWGDEYVAIDHILLGMLTTSDNVAQMLKDSGLTEENVEKTVEELRKGDNVTSASHEQTYNSLEKYANNLNQRATDGKLDPVIGRDDEIRRVIQILSRRTKNNPVLIGDAGVGKTAIAEGIAHRIVRGDVPENLKTKELYSLDMGALLAGA